MSKFLKFIVNLFLLCAIAVAAAILVPPLIGVGTTIVDSQRMNTNLPMGSVTYATDVHMTELSAGDKVLADDESSTYVYTIDTVDTATGEFTVHDTYNAAAQQQTLQILNTASKVVVTIPYIGYVVYAMHSIEGMIVLGLILLLMIILFILSELWRKDDDDEDDEEQESEENAVPVPAPGSYTHDLSIPETEAYDLQSAVNIKPYLTGEVGIKTGAAPAPDMDLMQDELDAAFLSFMHPQQPQASDKTAVLPDGVHLSAPAAAFAAGAADGATKDLSAELAAEPAAEFVPEYAAGITEELPADLFAEPEEVPSEETAEIPAEEPAEIAAEELAEIPAQEPVQAVIEEPVPEPASEFVFDEEIIPGMAPAQEEIPAVAADQIPEEAAPVDPLLSAAAVEMPAPSVEEESFWSFPDEVVGGPAADALPEAEPAQTLNIFGDMPEELPSDMPEFADLTEEELRGEPAVKQEVPVEKAVEKENIDMDKLQFELEAALGAAMIGGAVLEEKAAAPEEELIAADENTGNEAKEAAAALTQTMMDAVPESAPRHTAELPAAAAQVQTAPAAEEESGIATPEFAEADEALAATLEKQEAAPVQETVPPPPSIREEDYLEAVPDEELPDPNAPTFIPVERPDLATILADTKGAVQRPRITKDPVTGVSIVDYSELF